MFDIAGLAGYRAPSGSGHVGRIATSRINVRFDSGANKSGAKVQRFNYSRSRVESQNLPRRRFTERGR